MSNMEDYLMKQGDSLNEPMFSFVQKPAKNEVEHLKSTIDLLLHFKYMFKFVRNHCDIEFKIKSIVPEFFLDLENCHDQYNQLIESSALLEFVRRREQFYETKLTSYAFYKRENFWPDIQMFRRMPESIVDTIITEVPHQPNAVNDEYSSNDTSQSSTFKYAISNQDSKFPLNQIQSASSMDNSKKILYENLLGFLPKTTEIEMSHSQDDDSQKLAEKQSPGKSKDSDPKTTTISEADEDISMHVENELLQVEYWCSFESCRFKSLSLTQVKAHEERRHVKQIQKCAQDGCSSFFDTKDDLDSHVNQEHIYPKYHCAMEECDKEFPSDYRLKQHIKDQHKDAYLTCKVCIKKFKTRKNLLKHYHNIHSSDKTSDDDSLMDPQTSAEISESMKCTINECNKKFIKKSKLKQHIREQHKEEYLTCKFCDKVCRTRNNLTNHVWIMHEEGDYKCTYENCDFTSKYRKNLLNHKKLRHQRARKCPIDECGEMIPITRYQRHLSSLHKIKNYGCSWPDCGKSFADHNALKNHVRIHLNFKRFKCKWPDCGYASEQRFTVITHIRVCHFKLPRTKKKQMEMNISQDSLQNPYDYLEVCREDICI